MGIVLNTSFFAAGSVAANTLAAAVLPSDAGSAMEEGGGPSLRLVIEGRSSIARRQENDPNHALARYIEKKITEASANNQSPKELELELRASLPRNVAMILLEKIGTNLEYEPRWLNALAKELNIKPNWAERIILRRQTWLHPELPRILSVDEWFLIGRLLQPILEKRLDGNLQFMLAAMQIAPVMIRETFLNIVMNGGKDVPRESRPAFLKRIERARHGSEEAFKSWERFWGGQALKQDWSVKPKAKRGNGPFNDILAGMSYAKAVSWSLLDFSKWMERKLNRDSKRRYVLEAFWAAVDQEVLLRTRETPEPRPKFSELKETIPCDEVAHTLVHWMNVWETFAKELNAAHAIRPKKDEAVAVRTWMEKGDERWDIFAGVASDTGDPQAVHQTFLERGWEEEARVIANLLAGINDRPRVPVSQFAENPSDKKRLIRMEQRLEDLAEKFSFECKPENDLSQKAQNSRRVGGRLKELLEEAKKGKWDMKKLARQFRNDAALQKFLGVRAPVLADLFDFWLETRRNGNGMPPYLVHRLAFEPRGIIKPVFYEWLRRFSFWELELRKNSAG